MLLNLDHLQFFTYISKYMNFGIRIEININNENK